MRTTPSRTIQATACAIALIGLTACGGSDSEGSSTTSTSSSSADLTYDDDYAVDAARATESKRRAHDPNTKLSDDTPWATEDYIDTFNRNVTAMKEAGVVEKGTVKVNSVHLATSDPDAPGGWNLTLYQCSTSTARYFKGDKDVTTDPNNDNKPAPKGPQENVHLVSFHTPDQGKTWQIDDSQLLTGKRAAEAPCV
ncbi:hypothetical protein [Janibacter hoylei]|nr:hypothetical protein [Janibacter hoylei]MCT1620459.1 hypothetical protein [Janibacter hoylei]MCT2294514.1 hypothetical protein [Janibacter hoylei]